MPDIFKRLARSGQVTDAQMTAMMDCGNELVATLNRRKQDDTHTQFIGLCQAMMGLMAGSPRQDREFMQYILTTTDWLEMARSMRQRIERTTVTDIETVRENR